MQSAGVIERAGDNGDGGESVRERFAGLAQSPREWLCDARIELGGMADYARLRQFHYRGGRPGAVIGVLRMTIEQPTVVGRYLSRAGGATVVGVLVLSLPALSCRLRDIAVGPRYRGLRPREAAMVLNREVRTISRVVVDPRFRGLGLAVDLVRAGLAHEDSKRAAPLFTEALAAMGRVSPFFERAGMARYSRPPREDQARMMDALHTVGLDNRLAALGTVATASAALNGLNAKRRALLERELRRWDRATRGRVRTRVRARHPARRSTPDGESRSPETGAHGCAGAPAAVLSRACRELYSQPVYYLHRHADRVNHAPSGA